MSDRFHNVGYAKIYRAIRILFTLATILLSLPSVQQSQAAPAGTLGWRWDGVYYSSAQAACYAQWQWAGMDSGLSRFIGAYPKKSFNADCSWTSFQYLCPGETGGGINSCGTALPTSVSFYCDAGYSRVYPFRCVKNDEYQPQRPVEQCPTGNMSSGPRPSNATTPNPVILRDGTKFRFAEDFATSDGKFNIARTYRSRPAGRNTSLVNYPLGLAKGWQFTFEMELHIGHTSGSPSSPDAEITLVAPDGSAYDFYLTSSGDWAPDTQSGSMSHDYSVEFVGTLPSNLATLKNSVSNWLVTGPDNREWSLETLGTVNNQTTFDIARPMSVADLNGYTWTYSYDQTDRRLLSIVDSYNRTFQFDWDYFYITTVPNVSGSRDLPEAVQSITLPDGTKIVYEYDPAPATSAPSASRIERLVEVIWQNSGGTPVDSVEYHYENTDYPFALTGITDNRNIRVATYAYDSAGRVTSTVGVGGSDSYTIEYGKTGTTQTRRVTNPLGKAATYNFTPIGSSAFDTRLTSVDGEVSSHCVASNSQFTYDSNGFLETRTDEEGRVTSFLYDSVGRPIEITEADGTADERVTTITWNTTHDLPATVVQPRLTTAYTYDTAGKLTSLTETDTTSHVTPYPTSGQTRTWSVTYSGDLITAIDGPISGTGDTVSYTYDSSGYVATYTNEVGHVYTINSTNGRGQPTQITDPNGIVRTVAYDDRGRMTASTVDPAGINAQTTLDYDAAGNITKVTAANGSYLEIDYDGNDRITGIENNTGETVSYTRDGMGNVTLAEARDSGSNLFFKSQRAFDELGRLREVTRAGSAVWSLGYDKVGNLLTVTDPNSEVTTSTYDNLDRLVSFANERSDTTTWTHDAADGVASTTDPRTIVTSYVRNGWGEVISETSADIGTVTYERDKRGDITRKTDARGEIVDIAYDDAGRRISASYPNEPAIDVAYTYDTGTNGIGRLTGVTDAAGSAAYAYDAKGRVTQETRIISGETYVIGYTWDKDDNVTAISYPSGRVVTYGRNANGNISQVLTRETPTSSDVGIAWWVETTPFGPRQGMLHGNDLVDWRTYDEDGRLVSLAVEDASVNPATVRIDRYYAYLDGRNLTQITDGLNPGNDQYYSYTENGYLLNGSGPWGSIYYGTDGVGNLTQRSLTSGGTTSDAYFGISSTSNRLVNVSDNTSLTRTFGHDAAGNIINDTDAATSFAKDYGINAAGQLNVVVLGGQFGAEYLYDYLSRLSERYVAGSGQTSHYVHDLAGNIIAEYDGAGSVIREYIWLDERPVAVVDHSGVGPALYQVHTDHLERPVMMTDAQQAVVWEAVYLPFGGVHSITGSASLDQRFPGQWFQLETGLHYNWHRHYDPTTGRYIQADPLGMPDGPSRYAYVGNSPLMYVDREGLQSLLRRLMPYPGPHNPGQAPDWSLPDFPLGSLPHFWKMCLQIVPQLILNNDKDENGPKETATPEAEDLEGLSPEEVEELMEKNGWQGYPTKNGDGIRYPNPNKPGEQIRIHPNGTPGTSRPELHDAPYGIVSKGGNKIRFKLRR